MYGNIAKAHSKDKKTRYYYYCKNTVTPTGHECSFRLNIEQAEINKFVAKVISAMVNNPRFVEAIQAKIGTAVDTEDMEKQIAVLQGWTYLHRSDLRLPNVSTQSLRLP